MVQILNVKSDNKNNKLILIGHQIWNLIHKKECINECIALNSRSGECEEAKNIALFILDIGKCWMLVVK